MQYGTGPHDHFELNSDLLFSESSSACLHVRLDAKCEPEWQADLSEPLVCAHRLAQPARESAEQVVCQSPVSTYQSGRGPHILLPLDGVGYGPGIRLLLWSQCE